MRSVYVFCADGFEEVEGLTAVDLLRRGRYARTSGRNAGNELFKRP